MYPYERSLVKELADEPFVILGVNSDDTAKRLRDTMAKESITWPSFFDGGGTDGPIATSWGVRGWPTVLLIDHEGVIRLRDRDENLLKAGIKKLLPAAREARAAAAGSER